METQALLALPTEGPDARPQQPKPEPSPLGHLSPGSRARGALLLVAVVAVLASLSAAGLPAVRAGVSPRPGEQLLHPRGELPLESKVVELPLVAGRPSHPGSLGGFLTGEPEIKTFPWTPAARTVEEAFDLAFAHGEWDDVRFEEGSSTVTKEVLVRWVEGELLGGPDPFDDFAGRVPVPWPAGGSAAPDQVPPGSWVAYSRRQLCLIAAKSLTGARTKGYSNGLVRYLETAAGKCTPARGDFGRGLLFLLAACAADPLLAAGAQGPLVLAAKATPRRNVSDARSASVGVPLLRAGLRICQYGDGAAALAGLPKVPAEGCVAPTEMGVGRDFMTGGLRGQALQDISAAWLGGYIWGNDCGVGGGQDERLMVYMPEVFLLAFFLSQAPGTNPEQRHTPQLREPAWILGARRIMVGLDGTGRFNAPPRVDSKVPMTSDLVDVTLPGGNVYQMSSSRPFLAFMSENQDFEISDACPGLPPEDDPTCDRGCRTRRARRNRLGRQRAVEPSCRFSFEKQVRAWYNAVSLTSYAAAVRPALRAVVSSIGSGPWGSGLWWGDSQLAMLAMWLGHAAAAPTWGEAGTPLPLDYYIYAAFTENPGNQCYLHSSENCKACLAKCGTPPPTAYWLPGFAYTDVPDAYTNWGPPPPPAKACVDATASCGARGLQDVVAAYEANDVATLWSDVERALQPGGGASAAEVATNVFDALLAARQARGGGNLRPKGPDLDAMARVGAVRQTI